MQAENLDQLPRFLFSWLDKICYKQKTPTLLSLAETEGVLLALSSFWNLASTTAPKTGPSCTSEG